MKPRNHRTRGMTLLVPSMVFATAGAILIYAAQLQFCSSNLDIASYPKILTSGKSTPTSMPPSPTLSSRPRLPLPRTSFTRGNSSANFCSSIRPSP